MPDDRQTSNRVVPKKFKVKVTRNGPYLISGGVLLMEQEITFDGKGYSLGYREVRRYPLQMSYSLCRCGQSKTKPFCDGTHGKVNFDGTETASREPYPELAGRTLGPTLVLLDVEELCASSRFCDRAGGIWKLVEQSDNPKARKLAILEAANCPSGRLVVRDADGKAIEPVFEPSIVLVEDPQEDMNGPIWVRGGIPIEAVDGVVYEIRNRVTLCRCGNSANNPFCDGSH